MISKRGKKLLTAYTPIDSEPMIIVVLSPSLLFITGASSRVDTMPAAYMQLKLARPRPSDELKLLCSDCKELKHSELRAAMSITAPRFLRIFLFPWSIVILNRFPRTKLPLPWHPLKAWPGLIAAWIGRNFQINWHSVQIMVLKAYTLLVITQNNC